MYHSAPSLATMLHSFPLVLFHCNRSNGRGPRAAGWYADALQEAFNLSDEETANRVGVVDGGIVAWEEAFGASSLEERGKRRTNHSNATLQL